MKDKNQLSFLDKATPQIRKDYSELEPSTREFIEAQSSSSAFLEEYPNHNDVISSSDEDYPPHSPRRRR